MLPRHQTMRTVIEWSAAQLEGLGRRLLRRLSVFAGGWTLDAAEEVCTDAALSRGDVLCVLGRLAGQSFVVVEEQGESMRYRLLEVIRQYAGEHLVASGEAEVFRSHHAQWCLQLAEEAEPHLIDHDQLEWLEMLDRERANVRAALDWSLHSGDPLFGLRIAAALLWYWYSRGNLGEGKRWLENLLARAVDTGEIQLSIRAKALAAIGVLAMAQGAHHCATVAAEGALATFRSLGDTRGMMRAVPYCSSSLRCSPRRSRFGGPSSCIFARRHPCEPAMLVDSWRQQVRCLPGLKVRIRSSCL
jgi:non-specific serine/threonine protein kinase